MKLKLIFGVILLFSGVGTVVGIGLILLHMLDEYKKMNVKQVDDTQKDRYISEDVIEEFR